MVQEWAKANQLQTTCECLREMPLPEDRKGNPLVSTAAHRAGPSDGTNYCKDGGQRVPRPWQTVGGQPLSCACLAGTGPIALVKNRCSGNRRGLLNQREGV